MTMPRRALSAVLFLLAAAAPASANTFELQGSQIQGGLVIGHVDPGSRISLGKRALRVSPEGVFLLGFGRDAPHDVRVRVTYPGGATMIRSVRVAPRKYKTQRIDGLPPRQVTPSAEDMKRIRADSAAIAAVRAADTAKTFFLSRFTWPVRGRISGVYGSRRILNGKPRSPHAGVDIAAPLGTPVVAAADGIVTLVRRNMYFTGQTLMIDHGHGLTSVYAHMSEITARQGQRVLKGDPIGRVGASGRVTGPHLHWGVSLFKTPLDPALLVGPMPKPDE